MVERFGGIDTASAQRKQDREQRLLDELEAFVSEGDSDRRRRCRKAVSVLAVLLLIVASGVVFSRNASAQGVVVDLGDLGGEWAEADGINELGQVVGGSLAADGTSHAYVVNPQDTNGEGTPDLWYSPASSTDPRNALMQDIGLGGAYAINDASSLVTGITLPSEHAMLVTPLDADADGVQDTWFQDADGDGVNNLMRDLGTLGGATSVGRDVNNLGTVVGLSDPALDSYYPHGFVWDPRLADNECPNCITVTQHQITSSPAMETMPRLGRDAISDLVTFTVIPVLPEGRYGPGDIWYQRLAADGSPTGPAVQVENTAADVWSLDTSGDYIVYAAYEPITSEIGAVLLYQISTGQTLSLGSAPYVLDTRIQGDTVVWRQGIPGTSQVMRYDLSWLGTGQPPIVLAGPTPTTMDLDIGDRFVVWSQYADDNIDVVAYDLQLGTVVPVTSTLTVHEREASTSGPWIAWQAKDNGGQTVRIEALNMDTGDFRVVADVNALNYRPSIDGNLIAYETYIGGNMDIWAYRIDDRSLWPITSSYLDQYLSNVIGNQVAFVEDVESDSLHHTDIYVATLTWENEPVGMQDIGTLGGDWSTAVSINDLGDVVGMTETATAGLRPFLIEPLDANADGFPDTWFKDANADGVNDLMQDLSTLGGGQILNVRAINDARQIAGVLMDATGAAHAFLWDGTALNDLGTLGGSSSSPAAMNNFGDVVGTSVTSLEVDRAFAYIGGAMVNLGFQGYPQGVNGQGATVGYAYSPEVSHMWAFLWTPSTPPTPGEGFDSAHDALDDLCATQGISKGECQGLGQKLDASEAQLLKGHTQAAVNILEAFISEITSKVAVGKLTPEEGQVLIDLVEELIAAIQAP